MANAEITSERLLIESINSAYDVQSLIRAARSHAIERDDDHASRLMDIADGLIEQLALRLEDVEFPNAESPNFKR